MTNDKLPETTQDRIKADADKWSDDQLRYVYAVEKLAYIEGATAWAGWKVRYDDLKHEIALLKEVNNESLKLTERSQNRYAALKDQAKSMADALGKIKDLCEHDDYGDKAENCPSCIASYALQQFNNPK